MSKFPCVVTTLHNAGCYTQIPINLPIGLDYFLYVLRVKTIQADSHAFLNVVFKVFLKSACIKEFWTFISIHCCIATWILLALLSNPKCEKSASLLNVLSVPEGSRTLLLSSASPKTQGERRDCSFF
jgi:hypothetical protein